MYNKQPMNGTVVSLDPPTSGYGNSVLDSSSRKFFRELIDERDARVQATDSLWAKLNEVLAWIRDREAKEDAELWNKCRGVATNDMQAITNQLGPYGGPSRKELGAVEDSARTLILERKCSDMEEKLDTLGKDVHQKINVAGTEMRQHIDALVKDMRHQTSSQVAAFEKLNIRGDDSKHDLPGSNNELGTVFAEIQQQFKDLDQGHTKLSKDVTSIQSWLEASFPLSVVRASRVAILSLDLSPLERQTALTQLEAKERLLTVEMEKLC